MKSFKTMFTTFYSYKGGVGRTSALVNSALLRAIEGDRVVIIDFDLEAPGVSSYIDELISRQGKNLKLDNRPGVLEYLYEAVHSDKVTDIKSKAITKNDIGINVEGELWFIGAGNTSTQDYTRKLNSLNWNKIFEEKQGALLLENFKRQIVAEFNNPDYVFIDSRTGITEIGGVCTKYLSDLVVVLSSLNEQNLVGTSKVLSSFEKSKISTLFVASNVPVGLPWGEGQLFYERIQEFKKCIGKEPDVFIYHYPSLSLKEYLPSYFKLKDKKSVLKEDPLLRSYESLSKKINSKNLCSFEDFLMDEIVNRLFAFTEKAETDNKIEEAFSFFEKYYSHRMTLLESLKAIKFVIGLLNKSDEPKDLIISQEVAKAMKVIKESESLKKFPLHNILRRITRDRASDAIYNQFKDNYEDSKSDLYWFEILTSRYQMLAVEILASHENYQAIFDNIPIDKEAGFLPFARGVAAENLGLKPESSESFKIFMDHMEEDPMEVRVAGKAFACGYAMARLGDVSTAIKILEKAEDLIKKGDKPSFMFIPMKLKRTDQKDEFLKELNSFRKTINPEMPIKTSVLDDKYTGPV